MHNLSLVLFTSLAQAAVGMVALLALSPMPATDGGPRSGPLSGLLHKPGGFGLACALVLFGLGVLFSLLHLSDPLISFYSITNVATSWLSREILFVGVFGFSALLLFFVRTRAVAVFAAIAGIALIYVMSKVYTSVPVPFWQSLSTLLVFLSTGLLLGSVTLLLVRALGGREQGLLPIVAAIAVALRLSAGFAHAGLFSSLHAQPAALLYWHTGLLGLGFVALLLVARARPAERYAGLALICAALMWAGELCARIAFYDALTSFTM